MASVKAILDKTKTAKTGHHPVIIRVIHNRKRSIKTLFYIPESAWTGDRVKSTYSGSMQMNATLAKMIHQCRERILHFEYSGQNFDANEVFYPHSHQSTFVECIQEYAKTKAYRNARKYNNLADKIRQFAPDVKLHSITTEFLDEFKKWLSAQDRINSYETINRYLKFLKTVLNRQYRKGNFHDRNVLAYPTPTGKTSKIRLTYAEFQSLIAVNSGLDLVRDAFALQVYLRGLRIGDLLQLTRDKLKQNRLIFAEQKTGKEQNIQLIPEALSIIEKYGGISDWYILPILRMEPKNPKIHPRYQKHIESKTSMINRDLKLLAAKAGINKRLTTHVARHTFASWADQKGLTSREIQKLLNHSSLSVTENYLDGLRRASELDLAAGKVFDNL